MADDSLPDAPTTDLRPSTVAVTSGRPPHEVDQPLNTPITMASTYVAGGDREYGRYGNPTWQAFEEVLGELEGGRALAFSSGLAAVSVVLDLVGQGALVLAPDAAYQGSLSQIADLDMRGRLRSKLIDIASSTTQGLFTWPEIAKSLVPALFSRPKPANHSAPRRRMVGATAMDSTLFTVVGQP